MAFLTHTHGEVNVDGKKGMLSAQPLPHRTLSLAGIALRHSASTDHLQLDDYVLSLRSPVHLERLHLKCKIKEELIPLTQDRSVIDLLI